MPRIKTRAADRKNGGLMRYPLFHHPAQISIQAARMQKCLELQERIYPTGACETDPVATDSAFPSVGLLTQEEPTVIQETIDRGYQIPRSFLIAVWGVLE